MPNRYVFLDRDGTLVRDPGYVHRIADYQLLPGVVAGLRALARAGYRLAIVTNQSGIGRGYFDEASFHAFQNHLIADLSRHEIEIDATYFCPHRPDEGCACRKPAPGMLERAARELDVDLAQSWVVGDSPVDVGLAERAGCRAIAIGGDCAGVEEASALILQRDSGAQPLGR